MGLTMSPDPAATPLQAAVDEVDTAIEHLIKVVEDGALGDLGAAGLVGFLQSVESVRNKLPVVDRAAIRYGTEQGVARTLCERTMTRVLMSGLRLSVGEASRRVRAADHLADRVSPTGEPLGPYRSHLSRVQRGGLVTAEQVALIDDTLRKVDRCDPAAVEAGEVLLVESATRLGLKDLGQVAARLVDAIDPDGTLPGEEAEHRLRRFFHLRQRRDGCWVGDFRLTPECGQKLAALLGPLTKPQAAGVETTGEDGEPGARQVQPDDRTLGQRRHDAVEDVLDAALRSDDLPASGGTPTTLVIVMTYREWVTRLGTGSYGDGTPVSARTARDLADQAEVVWCVKDRHGKVLDLHRSRRIASRSQTLALCARDGGCSFPGCDVPPQWCERHHIISWQDGGPTNLEQPDPALPLPPPSLRQARLELPDQPARTSRVDPPELDRPPATTDPPPSDHDQQLEPA